MKKTLWITSILSLALFISCSSGSGSRYKQPKLTVPTNGKNPFIIIQNPTNATQAVDATNGNSNILPVQNYIDDMQRQGKKVLISSERSEIFLDSKTLRKIKTNNRSIIPNRAASNGNSLPWDYNLSTTGVINITTHDFWTEGSVKNTTTNTYTQGAVLKEIGAHCYVWYKAKSAISLDDDVFTEVKDKFDLLFEKELYIFGNNTSQNQNLSPYFININSYPRINIIIYDLKNDYESNPSVVEGGYFWSLDLMTNDSGLLDSTQTSNECECIHIDSGVLKDNKEQAYSTLAHEFQHLLNFVNKVLNSMNSQLYSLSPAAWYNEMMSMVCEDIMQSYLPEVSVADGPQSRLSLFNSTFQYGFTNWYSGNDVLVSYANAYAFGAFLLRNYGIDCIKEIAHNNYVNEASVLKAVQNYDDADPISSFSELLQRFYNVMLNPTGTYYSLNKSATKTYNINGQNVPFTCAAINLNSYASIAAQNMTYDMASKLYNGVPGTTYYGPVILENTYYLEIAPTGTCIIHIPGNNSSVSIPGEWSDYLNYYVELK